MARKVQLSALSLGLNELFVLIVGALIWSFASQNDGLPSWIKQTGEQLTLSAFLGVISFVLVFDALYLGSRYERRRLITAFVLLISSAITSIMAASSVDTADFFIQMQYIQNTIGKFALAMILAAKLLNPSLEIKLNGKWFAVVFVANEVMMCVGAITLLADVHNSAGSQEFFIACLAATISASVYCYTAWKQDESSIAALDLRRWLITMLTLGGVIVPTIIAVVEIEKSLPKDEFGLYKNFDSFTAFSLMLYMPFTFTRLHLPYLVSVEEEEDENQSISRLQMQEVGEPNIGSSNEYGVSSVQLNATENNNNLPTAVAVPVVG